MYVFFLIVGGALLSGLAFGIFFTLPWLISSEIRSLLFAKVPIFLLTFWRKNKGVYYYKGQIHRYSYFIGFKRAWVLAEIKTNPRFKLGRGEVKGV